MRKTIIIAGAAICIICTAVISYAVIERWGRDAIPSRDLTLSEYPKLFAKGAVIVIGENASEIERQAAEEIKNFLLKYDSSYIKVIDSQKIKSFKRGYNLVIIGTPKTNPLLEEVYAMTNVARVTGEFPGEGKGVLEILRNPWDESRVIFLIEGSDEKGVGFGVLKILIEAEEFKEFNFSSLEVDILNEKWVKENINPRICEEIFLEALYKRDIQVFINQYPPSHVPLKVKKRLEELGVKVNWSDARVPIGVKSAYYPAIVPREHLDDIVKEGFSTPPQ